MRYLLIPLLAISLLACSKVSQENYEKIKVGMNYDEVVGLLGKPENCDSVLGANKCRWGSAASFISINFIADKVVVFSSQGLK